MIVVTSDGQSFNVSKDIMELSDFMRDANEEDELHVPNVAAREFAMIMRFCEMHIEDPMEYIPTPLRTLNLVDYIGVKYNEFVDSIDVHSELVPLILANDFLGIETFTTLLCAKMAVLAQTSDSVDAFLTQFSPELLTI